MARLVQTVVCGYALGELPAAWLVAYHRIEKALVRAKLRVQVKLAPLEGLPDEAFQVLIVPPAIEAAARAAAPDSIVLATTSSKSGQCARELIARLTSGTDVYAETVRAGEPLIVRTRGALPL